MFLVFDFSRKTGSMDCRLGFFSLQLYGNESYTRRSIGIRCSRSVSFSLRAVDSSHPRNELLCSIGSTRTKRNGRQLAVPPVASPRHTGGWLGRVTAFAAP